MIRIFFLALVGIAVTGLAITGWRALSTSPPPPPHPVAQVVHTEPMVSILVAGRDLTPGTFLRPGDLSSVSMGVNVAPAHAWHDTAAARAALAGALVRRAVTHDSWLNPADLLLAGDHGFLSALLTPGMRAFAIPHDQIISGADLIWPGDKIDLILTQQMPSTLQIGHEISAETVLSDLRVLAIGHTLIRPETSDEKASPNAPADQGVVTVEVSSTDAEKLAVALRLGRVAFAVRSTAAAEGKSVSVSDADRNRATWADNVMHSLDQVPSVPPAISLHVYEGSSDKEYKF